MRWAVRITVGLVVAVAATDAFASAARNAAITWTLGGDVRGANVDGSGRRVVVPHNYDDAGDPAWTRDGTGLAYFVRYSDTVKIAVLWPETGKGRELGTGDSRSFAPTWSPDAKRIAVSEDWGGYGLSNPEATIKIVTLATNTWTPLTKRRRHQVDHDPAWSPDGRTIAFSRQVAGRTPTLLLMRPDGSAIRRLTHGRSPSWSPDSQRLAYALGGSVYEIGADGRGRVRIISGLNAPLVRWSPDGAKLFYTSGRDAWVANADGTHRTRVLHERYAIAAIAWRPGS